MNVYILSLKKYLSTFYAKKIKIYSNNGDISVYSGHAPLLSYFIYGIIYIEEDINKHVIFISEGIVEIKHNKITILANVIELCKNWNKFDIKNDIFLAKNNLKKSIIKNISLEIKKQKLILKKSEMRLKALLMVQELK